METDDQQKLPAVNGPAANIASSSLTGVHSQTVHTASAPADGSTGHRSSQAQSVISVDETVPYTRAVDRSELLSGKSASPLLLFFLTLANFRSYSTLGWVFEKCT